LTELKRRNVYRAAVAYRVVAWFLTQLTTQVLSLFEIPNSAVRFVVIALAKDSHLWTDTFDRKLTDVFGVESEIAKRIAESLQAKLTGREERALAVKSTNNPEA
jgi:hypothetical protein